MQTYMHLQNKERKENMSYIPLQLNNGVSVHRVITCMAEIIITTKWLNYIIGDWGWTKNSWVYDSYIYKSTGKNAKGSSRKVLNQIQVNWR